MNDLKSSDIDITRIGKDYISVKLPNSKKAKRFKGDMFSEEFKDFKSMEQLRGKTETRAKEFRNRADEQTNIDASRRSFMFTDQFRPKESRDFKIIKFKQNLSKRDQEFARLKRELDKQMQKRAQWLEIQVGRVPKRSKYIQNTIMIAAILVSIYTWRLYLQKNDLIQENQNMKMYIKQNIDGK